MPNKPDSGDGIIGRIGGEDFKPIGTNDKPVRAEGGRDLPDSLLVRKHIKVLGEFDEYISGLANNVVSSQELLDTRVKFKTNKMSTQELIDIISTNRELWPSKPIYFQAVREEIDSRSKAHLTSFGNKLGRKVQELGDNDDDDKDPDGGLKLV